VAAVAPEAPAVKDMEAAITAQDARIIILRIPQPD
jgi:hypothetical protein